MQLGEVVFGGVGSGLYGMLVFAILAGLMVGRTPEYLSKKIEARSPPEGRSVVVLAKDRYDDVERATAASSWCAGADRRRGAVAVPARRRPGGRGRRVRLVRDAGGSPSRRSLALVAGVSTSLTRHRPYQRPVRAWS